MLITVTFYSLDLRILTQEYHTCVVMNWLHLKALPGTEKERLTTYVGPRSIRVAPLLGVTYSSSWTATTGLNPCFVLSGNTDKEKMAWNQEGKERVNEGMRQRGKGTEHYVVGKKWTWKSRHSRSVPHDHGISWSYLNMYRFLMNYTPSILAQNGGKKRTAGPKWWTL